MAAKDQNSFFHLSAQGYVFVRMRGRRNPGIDRVWALALDSDQASHPQHHAAIITDSMCSAGLHVLSHEAVGVVLPSAV